MSGTESDQHARRFIAHRGVNLHSTIAGENSLEAIGYARRAGFAAIETDVRLTSDRELVVMHDEMLNRTCLKADESEIPGPVPIAGLTLAELKANYLLKADERKNRTRVPTLREYLVACKDVGLLPFIEPKLYDSTGRHYRGIIRLADEVIGSGNYIITSNNRANRLIRDLGILHVRVMGVLYQTTFEELAGLGNAIMAISTSRFSRAEFARHATRAIHAGIPIESHADDYPRFSIIDAHRVDYVSTDLLAPDLTPRAKRTVYADPSDFGWKGPSEDDGWSLRPRGVLRLQGELPDIAFGGMYLELEMKGECTVRMAHQKFALTNPGMQGVRYQLLLYKAVPHFEIIADGHCHIQRLEVTVAKF